MLVTAVVLGAGSGVRLGAGQPKAHVRAAGRTLLQWSAEALARAKNVSAVLPVIGPEGDAVVREIRTGWSEPAQLLDPVPGGNERQDSVAAGLAALPSACEWVLVHDAARCLITPADVDAVFEAARETGAALLVAPLDDTVKEVSGERVLRTPDRRTLVRALTPQVFRTSLLRDALVRAAADDVHGTDCSSLIERLGTEVRTCVGSAENFKVTTPFDLERAELILNRRGRPG